MERKSSFTFKRFIATTLVIILTVFCSFSFDSLATTVITTGVNFDVNTSSLPLTGASNMCGEIETAVTGNGNHQMFLTYTYNVHGATNFLTTSEDVYGYKIQFTENNMSLSSTNVTMSRFVVGNYSDILKMNRDAFYLSNPVGNGWTSSCWVVNDGKIMDICIGVLTRSFEIGYYNSSGDYEQQYFPYFDYSSFVHFIEITPYTKDEMHEEILAELKQSNANDAVVIEQLESILAKTEETNSWLEKIWNSIQEFFTPKDEDKDSSDKFKEDSAEQGEVIDDLNEENKVEKIDPDDLDATIDENIDIEDMSDFSGVLALITNDKYVLQMLLIALTLIIVAYVFYGKR